MRLDFDVVLGPGFNCHRIYFGVGCGRHSSLPRAPRNFLEFPRNLLEFPRHVLEFPRRFLECPRNVMEILRHVLEHQWNLMEFPWSFLEFPRNFLEFPRYFLDIPRHFLEFLRKFHDISWICKTFLGISQTFFENSMKIHGHFLGTPNFLREFPRFF